MPQQENNRYGRAVRRPSAVPQRQKTAESAKKTTASKSNASSAGAPRTAPLRTNASSSGAPKAATSQNSRKYTAARRELHSDKNRRTGTQNRGLSIAGYGKNSDKALIKREQKALVEAQREKEWQSEVERVRGGVDKIMLVIVLLLLAMGALIMYSASYPTALDESGDSLSYLKRHLMFMAIGGVFMFVASLMPYTWFKKWGAFAAYGFSVVLLLAVLVIGTSEGEAKRWIYLGGFSIQPSEIMKVSLVLILAWYIDRYKDKMKERNGFLTTYKYNTLFPIIFVGIACGLVLLEKHLSGTVILGVLGISVMIVGGCHLGYTLATAVAGGGAAVLMFLIANPYALKRITTFTSEEADKLAEAWQTTQGVLAIGSGGLFGVGFSESRQKFGYVSMAHNDFVFTIWCEELGFIGGVLLIALFAVFVWRGYVIAMRAPDTFSMLTVFGITTQVGLQAFLNMMVVCDIIPNTGISLPFFSYGGSSLIMLMAEMGLILSISRQYYRKKGLG